VQAMAAMQLGKHVYCEKPLTHDIYEARMLTGETDPSAQAGRILEAGARTVIIKRGGGGAYVRSEAEAFELQAPPIDAVEPSGAGDAFAAGLIVGLLDPDHGTVEVDGQVVDSFNDVSSAVHAPHVALTIWRSGAEVKVPLDTVLLSGHDIDRVLIWAGATLQEPHRAMAAQRGIEPGGVFIAFFMYGSPASRYKLWAGRRITEVDGVPVPDLDAFIRAVAGRPDHSSLRLKTVAWNGAADVITMRLDRHYWPAYELRRSEDGWQRVPLE